MTQDNNTLRSCGKIKISYANWVDSPNDYTDGLIGDLYIWRRRQYSLGEDVSNIDISNCCNWDEHEAVFREYIKSTLPKYARMSKVSIEPVYMYIHSGETISRSPFPCPWDSGQVGFFVVDPYKVKREIGWHVKSKADREKLLKEADCTFRMWDAYIRGNVYSVSAEDEQYICYGDEELEKSVFDAVVQLLAWPKDAKEPLLQDEQVRSLTPLLKSPTTENINQLKEIMSSHGYSLPKFKGELAEYYSIY